MKTILALTSALLVGSAYAVDMQNPLATTTGKSHMFEFNADSLLNGVLSFSKSKTHGSSADNDLNLDLRLNYAYTLPDYDKIQIGGGINYAAGTQAGRGDIEDYGFNLAAYFNSTNDLQNAAYGSIKWGIDWANTYGNGNTSDEVGKLQLAVGKRMDLSYWGIKHLTYTPEIAFVNEDSTTGSALEYSQSLEFRFLQFSVFF